MLRISHPCAWGGCAAQPPIQCHALTCVCGWKLNPMHWACSHARSHRAAQQIQDGDDGQPAGAASARSVEGVRRGRSDIWPYPMARSASPAASAHVGKPLDPSSRAQADSGCWGGFAWAGPVRRCQAWWRANRTPAYLQDRPGRLAPRGLHGSDGPRTALYGRYARRECGRGARPHHHHAASEARRGPLRRKRC